MPRAITMAPVTSESFKKLTLPSMGTLMTGVKTAMIRMIEPTIPSNRFLSSFVSVITSTNPCPASCSNEDDWGEGISTSFFAAGTIPVERLAPQENRLYELVG